MDDSRSGITVAEILNRAAAQGISHEQVLCELLPLRVAYADPDRSLTRTGRCCPRAVREGLLTRTDACTIAEDTARRFVARVTDSMDPEVQTVQEPAVAQMVRETKERMVFSLTEGGQPLDVETREVLATPGLLNEIYVALADADTAGGTLTRQQVPDDLSDRERLRAEVPALAADAADREERHALCETWSASTTWTTTTSRWPTSDVTD